MSISTKIKTLNGEESQETKAVSGLKVSKSSEERMWIDFPVAYTKDDLPVDDEDVATPEKIKKWKYLERIAGEITQGQCISIGQVSKVVHMHLKHFLDGA